MTASTRDIGFAIRDFLEDREISVFKENAAGELDPQDDDEKIDFIDVSDPDNPVILLDNGQKFIVRIFLQD